MEQALTGVAKTLNCPVQEVPYRVAGLQTRIVELAEEVKQARQGRPTVRPEDVAAESIEIEGLRLAAAEIAGARVRYEEVAQPETAT